jgi:NAD(P)-dependent dehydrogenase (short-subunit alcohol dehydrogenase family)
LLRRQLRRHQSAPFIGEDPPPNEHLLVYNVMPIYWTINALLAEGLGPCRVLSVASQTHRIPQTNTALYCASKAALVMLTKVMARELARRAGC